uniref:Uncharacterized protein n=1 Tax=Triticum urartu TaxID=4572 RepID=A0A8R7NYZ7_TRIUA
MTLISLHCLYHTSIYTSNIKVQATPNIYTSYYISTTVSLLQIHTRLKKRRSKNNLASNTNRGEGQAGTHSTITAVTSQHEGHGVKPGQAAPHVLFPRADHQPRAHHGPSKLLEPGQEEDDAPARDEDEGQRDDPYAQLHHQHPRFAAAAKKMVGLCFALAPTGSLAPCSLYNGAQLARL